jgi:ABC-type phosphate/phosphonate transport system substrate-binding protein
MQNKMSLFSPRNLVICLAIFAGLVAIVTFYAEPVLRISIIPGEPPFLVNRKMQLLTEYLEQKIGMKVEFRPKRSGDALVESLLFKELDLVWIDGARLAQARSLTNDGVMPIVQREEDEFFSPLSAGTPPDRAYSWVVRAGMDTELRKKLTAAFLTMHTDSGKGKGVLVYQRTRRFVPARGGDSSFGADRLDSGVTE